MATGVLERIDVTAGGSGYLPASPPTVTIGAPPGPLTQTQATATAVVSAAGAVIAVLLGNPGHGYDPVTPPSVTIAAPSSGTQATAKAVLSLPSYATIVQLRAYLPDVTSGVADDNLVQDILDRATAIGNDSAVGLNFVFAGYSVFSRPVPSSHGPYLLLPAHARNSIASVTLLNVLYVPGQDYQVVLDQDGVHESLFRVTNANASAPNWWPPPQRDTWGWMGYIYDIVAAWGYGPPPASLVEVTLEVAVNIWKSRAAGRFTNVVGPSDGGAVGYEGALTPQQKSVLKGLQALYTRDVVSI